MEAAAARRLLEAERRRLLRARQALERDHLDAATEQESAGELTPLDQHQADAASEAFEREKAAALMARIVADLREVDDAFVRLDADGYGRCHSCGSLIEDERLEAVPATRFCGTHQQMWELRRLTLSIPPGLYADADAESAYGAAVREALAHLEFLPADDELIELLELGPEEAALHLGGVPRGAAQRWSADDLELAEARESDAIAQEVAGAVAEERDRLDDAAALAEEERGLGPSGAFEARPEGSRGAPEER